MNYLKKLFEPTDMTTGNTWKKIVLFTIPMLVGNIAQQLYSTVDSIVVGKYLGDNALAAVGSAGSILNLLFVLFVGISVGASIMVAQYFGAKAKEDLANHWLLYHPNCCVFSYHYGINTFYCTSAVTTFKHTRKYSGLVCFLSYRNGKWKKKTIKK